MDTVDVAALKNSESTPRESELRRSRSYGPDTNEKAHIANKAQSAYSAQKRFIQSKIFGEGVTGGDNEQSPDARRDDEKQIIVGHNVENASDAAQNVFSGILTHSQSAIVVSCSGKLVFAL